MRRIPGPIRDPPAGGADDGAALIVAPPSPVAALDARLARLARREAWCRLALGRLAAAFCSVQGHHGLGFARLGDYTRERLGLSAREVQSLAAVARACAGLPHLTAAFIAGELSWTTLRLLCDVARPDDEHHWLAAARAQPPRALRARIREIRDPYADRPAPDFDPEAEDAIDGETPVRVRLACPRHVRRRWHHAVELARRMLGEQAPVWRAAEAIAAEALAGGPRRPGEVGGGADEPWGAAAVPCGAGAGRDRPAACAPDPPDGPDGPPGRSPDAADPPNGCDLVERPSARRRDRAIADHPLAPRVPPDPACTADGGGAPPAPAPVATAAPLPRPWRPAADPATLDARMQRVLAVLRRLDAEIGRALAAAAARRVPRALGFPSLVAYARARLGISAGKARALLALDRRAGRVPAFGLAYARGELSWARALTLLPVVSASTADAWVARARAITVRALEAEVEEALDRWDAAPAAGIPGPRPPDAPARVGNARWDAEPLAPRTGDPDAPAREVASPDQGDRTGEREHDSIHARQIGARSTVLPGTHAIHPSRAFWLVDAEIAFVAPRSVAVLLYEAIAAFTRQRECRWWALTRLLGHVIHEWEAQPGHRDPIFARDGWRCAVPACVGRRNLHDHHIRFRSRGGDNQQPIASRSAPGTISAGSTPAAPDALEWALGVDRDGRAWRRVRGDRYQ